jgi:hypothetical protein
MNNMKLIALILAISGTNLLVASEFRDRINSASMWEIKNWINNRPEGSDRDTQAYVQELLRQIDAGERKIIGLDATNVQAWRSFLADQKAPVALEIEMVELSPELEERLQLIEKGQSQAGSLLALLNHDPNAASEPLKRTIKALIIRMDRSTRPDNIKYAFGSKEAQIQKWRKALGL